MSEMRMLEQKKNCMSGGTNGDVWFVSMQFESGRDEKAGCNGNEMLA